MVIDVCGFLSSLAMFTTKNHSYEKAILCCLFPEGGVSMSAQQAETLVLTKTDYLKK